jgi:mxaJ protein
MMPGWTTSALVGLAIAACSAPSSHEPRTLRVCADPNNLPFSNEREQGFENRIAEVVARELGAELHYVWKPQRRGFVRTGLRAGACDVVIGMAREVDMALTTRAYYRSSYVFVRPADVDAITRPIVSFDDPRLASLRIGVQLVGDDYSNSPPAHALARRGLAANLVGFTVYGDYAADSPPADVVRAVARGDIPVAVAWGPMAGYFAVRSERPLAIDVIAAESDGELPLRFDIAMAVARGRDDLRRQLDAVIERVQPEIDAILAVYGVPRVERAEG